jgi:hypothetical protein
MSHRKTKLVVGFEVCGTSCYLFHASFLLDLRRHVPLKHLLIYDGLHCVMSQKARTLREIITAIYLFAL